MSKPIHTPGPISVNTASGDCDLISGDKSVAIVSQFNWLANEVNQPMPFTENARLLAAAYNAFDSAAKKLNLNAVECAERMADSGIAELVAALELHYASHVAFEHGDDAEAERQYALAIERTRAVLAKVKGGAS
jgi:hypothetical protein